MLSACEEVREAGGNPGALLLLADGVYSDLTAGCGQHSPAVQLYLVDQAAALRESLQQLP